MMEVQRRSYYCNAMGLMAIILTLARGVQTSTGTETSPEVKLWPESENDFRELGKQAHFHSHPGYQASLQTLDLNRSHRHAYIVLIGAGQSEKSEFMESLMPGSASQSIAPVPKITEHTFLTPIRQLGVGNAALKIIDIPGFRGKGYACEDAEMLAGLDNFFQQHSELRSKRPNAVLIFMPPSAGESWSYLWKLLQNFFVLEETILSSDFSNAIFITHKNDSKDQNALKSFSMRNGTLLVRNGLSSIKHQALAKVYSSLAKDPLGSAIVGEFYSAPSVHPVSSVHTEVNNGCAYYSILQNLANPFASQRNLNKNQTEVEEALERVYETLPVEVQMSNQRALGNLLEDLRLQNISKISEVPKSQAGLIKLYREIPASIFVEKVLLASLDIAAPSWSGGALIVGNGFNVLTDQILPSNPFNFEDTRASTIGFKLPSAINAHLRSDALDVFQSCPDTAAYFKSKLKRLNLESGVQHSYANYIQDPLSGINILSDTSRSLTGIQERRKFKLALSPFATTNQEFIDSVESLPAFNPSHVASVYAWKEFFDQWGSHVVSSVYGGGAVEVKLREEDRGNFESEFGKAFKVLTDSSKITSREASNFEFTLLSGSQLRITTPSPAIISQWEESLAESPIILRSDVQYTAMPVIVDKVSKFHGKEARKALKVYLNPTPTSVPEPMATDRLISILTAQHAEMITLFQGQQTLLMELLEELKSTTLEHNTGIKELVREFEKERNLNANRDREYLNRFDSQSASSIRQNANLRSTLNLQFQENQNRSQEISRQLHSAVTLIQEEIQCQVNGSMELRAEMESTRHQNENATMQHLAIIARNRNADLAMNTALKTTLQKERLAHENETNILRATLLKERESYNSQMLKSISDTIDNLRQYREAIDAHDVMILQKLQMNAQVSNSANSDWAAIFTQLQSYSKQYYEELRRMRESFQAEIDKKDQRIVELARAPGMSAVY